MYRPVFFLLDLFNKKFSSRSSKTSPLLLERLSVSSSVEGAEAPLRTKMGWSAGRVAGALQLGVCIVMLARGVLCKDLRLRLSRSRSRIETTDIIPKTV